MACYYPLRALDLGVSAETGKKLLKVISRFSKIPDTAPIIKLPCGNCIGCREDRAKSWAIRCVHEASLYTNNCFITLTFCDGTEPGCKHVVVPVRDRISLNKSYFQKFMKRLRKKYGKGVRYYHCGEYGERFERPHHHACLFNFDFPLKTKENPDGKTYWKNTHGGILYRSQILEELWPYGWSTVGSVTFESAAYVARYVVKKINGKMAPDHYQGRLPEYTTMSRRPGIAKNWFKKYKDTDIALSYRNGFITMNGRTYKIPKYYDVNFELTNPDEYGEIKQIRMEKAKNDPDNLPPRLKAREKCHRARLKKRTRTYEN